MDLDALIDVDTPDDLAAASMDELRRARNELQEVENGLSYARRIVQGRLDTVAAESERRSAGSTADSTIVDRLPSALAAGTRAAGLPRPPQDLEPPEWVDALVAELDTIVGPAELGRLGELDADRLRGVTDGLAGVEQAVSAARREVHARIDVVQGELVERYRAGASVDDLLP